MTEEYDVVGIGNAIVDFLAYVDESFLEKHGLNKGAMTLIDEKTADMLRAEMRTSTECSGGSVANTQAGLAMLGAKAAFIGKAKDDAIGKIFAQEIKRSSVHFPTPLVKEGKGSSYCLIFVTEEATKFERNIVERTMATHLGASTSLSEADIDFDVIKNSKVTYLEGYLWDEPGTKAAISRAMAIAHKHNRKVAFSLSDPFCVDRHRAEFLDIVRDHVDILFSNEHEIQALFEETDIRKILFLLSNMCDIAVVTRGEKGSYIIAGEAIYNVQAAKVEKVYDVTGAGDLYAAGFLYGYVNDYAPDDCARLAGKCAAEVIQFLGARPATKLSDLLKTAS